MSEDDRLPIDELTQRHLSSINDEMMDAILGARLREHAFARACLGRDWLDDKAPPDWRLQMMSIGGGVVVSFVHLQYGNQTPLVLAHRRVPGMLGLDGRPDHIKIYRHFCGNRPLDWPKTLGFEEMNHRVGQSLVNKDVSSSIDCHLLNEAWARVLNNLGWYERTRPYPPTNGLLAA